MCGVSLCRPLIPIPAPLCRSITSVFEIVRVNVNECLAELVVVEIQCTNNGSYFASNFGTEFIANFSTNNDDAQYQSDANSNIISYR